ncbi:DUF3558 family protein [Actinophytocola sp.]|uniref:DUF3558 family protein n=1 Tax=Actinophytocola sp. TaxID=1872138 RepID=UPI002ED562EA
MPSATRSTPPTTTTTFPPTPPPAEPPPVTRPLDPSAYATEGTVCDLLTDPQAIELGMPSPGESHAISETFLGCNRLHALAEREVEYNLWLDNDLLEEVFSRNKRGDFMVVDVAGQPAVIKSADPAQVCHVTVGLASRKGIEVMATDDRGKACALAMTIAEQMVRNLGGG